MGCSSWGCTESDTTERLTPSLLSLCWGRECYWPWTLLHARQNTGQTPQQGMPCSQRLIMSRFRVPGVERSLVLLCGHQDGLELASPAESQGLAGGPIKGGGAEPLVQPSQCEVSSPCLCETLGARVRSCQSFSRKVPHQ